VNLVTFKRNMSRNLIFKPKKSKILITSKKINKEGTWKLGNEPIEETGEYKYLGYFINRSLKSNFLVNSFLKEKADKQLNCTRHISYKCN
jgi:hypothetical protein